jgi:Zn-dependent protease with chaperone function
MAYDLQAMGEDALMKMGISGRNLLVLPIQTNFTPVACSLGFRVDIQPRVVWIAGSILVNKQTLELFSEEEWNFIIHHDCAHIVSNDSIASLIVNIP